MKKELIEYMPFGEYARKEMYGSSSEVAWFYFTGKPLDDETGLYYYGARYYMPSLGRFITPDSIVQDPMGNPQTLNRYSYAGNNPVLNIDPSGHFWFSAIVAIVKATVSFAVAHPVIAGAIVGAAAGGIQSYQATGTVNPLSIGLGALQGGLSGWTLGLSAAKAAEMGIGSGLFLLKASAATSLAGQIAGAAGASDVSQGFQYASMGLAATYAAWHVGLGIRDWVHESRFRITDLKNNIATPKSGDKIFVNGILTPYDGAVDQAAKAGANLLAHNPTTSAIADLTESFLGKITFTSSVSRQLANSLIGLEGITLTGYSQGAIIIGNTMLDLGLSSHRSVVAKAIFQASPLSQPEAYLSAAVAGVSGNNVIYSNKVFDVINITGPNLNPIKTAGGAVGGGLFFGFNEHTSY